MAARRNKKKSSGNKYVFLGLIAVIALVAMSCGLFYASDRSKKDVLDTPSGNKQVSLEAESIEAQRMVDNILLQKSNWQLIENDHGVKEEEIVESGAKVRINQRKLAVGVPFSTSLAGAGEWMKTRLEKSGLVYMSGEMSTYKKWDAYKVRVGIKTKAGEGTKDFLTDTVVFFHNGNLTKEDKDVKQLPEEPVEKEPESRKYSGKLAVIIDDCGYDMASVRKLLDTGLPFSYAILPGKAYSSDVLEMVKSKGCTPLLHLPMEPMSKSAMSEGGNTILTSQSDSAKRALLRRHLNSLHGVVGINNHQGSKATSDKATMEAVLREAKAKGLFFVDSRTSSASVARDMAKKMKVPTARNDIFLDNSSDVQDIRTQIYKAFAMADKNGSAIAICHARSNTAKCWQKYADEFRSSGIEFVAVSELLY